MLLVLGVIAAIGTGAGLAPVNIGVAVNGAVLVLVVFSAISLMRTTVQLDAREISIKVAGIFGTTIPYKFLLLGLSRQLSSMSDVLVVSKAPAAGSMREVSQKPGWRQNNNGAPNTKFGAPSLANSLVTDLL